MRSLGDCSYIYNPFVTATPSHLPFTRKGRLYLVVTTPCHHPGISCAAPAQGRLGYMFSVPSPFTKKQGMLSHPLPCFYTYFRIVSDAFSSAREQVITQCTLDLDVSASISPKNRSNAEISSPQIFRAESI